MESMQYFKGTPETYTSPRLRNTTLRVEAYSTLFGLPDSWTDPDYYNVKVSVYANGNLLCELTSSSATKSITFTEGGYYTVVYEGGYTYTPGQNPISELNSTLTYNFVSVENYYPLKKWTITDVINRLLQLERPIRQGETPRYTFNAEQAALFDNILAPQFSFTKQTLRECLQEVGGVVHGEPRLKIMQDESGEYYYEIVYDLYASTKKSGVYTRPYIKESVKQVIEQYCSNIDSSAENLVNALQESVGGYLRGRNGVITEPYNGGYKTTI